MSEFEDQDDSGTTVYGLDRERNQSQMQFANIAWSAFLKADSHGDPLPDRRKGMIFLKRAKTPGHLEDHIMPKTGGPRRFTDILDAIWMLSRRPTASQAGAFLDVDEQGDSEEEQEGNEASMDCDSEGGALIPLDDSDLQGEYDEDDVLWALSQFRQDPGRPPKGRGVPAQPRPHPATRPPQGVRLKPVSALEARARCKTCHQLRQWSDQCPSQQQSQKEAGARAALVSSTEPESLFCGMVASSSQVGRKEDRSAELSARSPEQESPNWDGEDSDGGFELVDEQPPEEVPTAPGLDAEESEWLAKKRRRAAETGRAAFQRMAKRAVVDGIASDIWRTKDLLKKRQGDQE
ncbi:unnamed protein product [Prorocentrum cordatum]|uniref:Uncharacterized protein n=1 Tax=Prorocentrum cordatum TaxID=2364126 RepID=A0ABN9Y492_9DINO|nr:unnamed protein product [Polarella glacialis]